MTKDEIIYYNPEGQTPTYFPQDINQGIIKIKVDNLKTVFKGVKEINHLNDSFSAKNNNLISLRPFERAIIGTGLTPKLCDNMLIINTYHGIARVKGLTILNSPAIITSLDNDKEIELILYNGTPFLVKVLFGEVIGTGHMVKKGWDSLIITP